MKGFYQNVWSVKGQEFSVFWSEGRKQWFDWHRKELGGRGQEEVPAAELGQCSQAPGLPLVRSSLENGIEPLRKPCAHLVCEQLDDCLRILWPELIHSNCSLLCMLKLHSEI